MSEKEIVGYRLRDASGRWYLRDTMGDIAEERQHAVLFPTRAAAFETLAREKLKFTTRIVCVVRKKKVPPPAPVTGWVIPAKPGPQPSPTSTQSVNDRLQDIFNSAAHRKDGATIKALIQLNAIRLAAESFRYINTQLTDAYLALEEDR